MKKSITLTGIESAESKITLLADREKYTIWKLDKKTNKDSLPYQQFQKFRPMVGDTFQVEVWEAPDSFVNDKGQKIEYTKRYINYFILDGQGDPTIAPEAQNQATSLPIPEKTQSTTSDTKELYGSILELTERIKKLEQTVQGHDTLLVDLRGKDAAELHKSFKPEEFKLLPEEGFEDEATKELFS